MVVVPLLLLVLAPLLHWQSTLQSSLLLVPRLACLAQQAMPLPLAVLRMALLQSLLTAQKQPCLLLLQLTCLLHLQLICLPVLLLLPLTCLPHLQLKCPLLLHWACPQQVSL